MDPALTAIAHRLSTSCAADNSIVLKDGGVAEQSTHEQLFVRCGLNADLYHILFPDLPATPTA